MALGTLLTLAALLLSACGSGGTGSAAGAGGGSATLKAEREALRALPHT